MNDAQQENSQDYVDPVQFLSQSPNRVAVLGELDDDEGITRYTIEERVDATRRTILRILNDLAQEGYVQEIGEGYRRTAFGGWVFDRYKQFIEDIQFEEDLAQFLRNVPDGIFSFDLTHLDDCDIVLASNSGSYAPLDRLLDERANNSRIQELAPGVESRSVDQLVERVRSDEEVLVEVVLSGAAFEAASSEDQYVDVHETIAASEAVDLFVVQDAFEIGVCIAGDTVCMGFGGADNHLRGLCISENDVVREWAERYIEEYIESADSL